MSGLSYPAPAAPWWRLAALGLVAVGAFWASAWIARSLLPFPNIPQLRPKYEHFARGKDSYDTLFLGSSRFYHQIIPPEYDALVEKATGHRPHSFNVSYDGMWPPESYYLLRRLLQLRPQHLKWVFIDAMEIKAEMDDVNEPTQRQAWWHDWYHTQLAIYGRRQSRFFKPAGAEALDHAHWLLFWRFITNLGRGAEMLGQWLGDPDQKAKTPPWKAAEGYAPGPNKHMAGAELAEYHEELGKIERKLDLYPPAPIFKEAMERIIAEIRAAGAEPIFVIAPTINAFENMPEAPAGAALFAFNDPHLFPELYDTELHYDAWHLNEKGAHLFTRLLAERFAKLGSRR